MPIEDPIRVTPERAEQVRRVMEAHHDTRADGLKAFDDAMHDLKTRDVVDALHAFIRGDAWIESWPGNQEGCKVYNFVRKR